MANELNLFLALIILTKVSGFPETTTDGSSYVVASSDREINGKIEPKQGPDNNVTFRSSNVTGDVPCDEECLLTRALLGPLYPTWQGTYIPSGPDKNITFRSSNVTGDVPCDEECLLTRALLGPLYSNWQDTVDIAFQQPSRVRRSVYPQTPEIYEMRVDTNVSNRFAKTLVTSKVRNSGHKAQEAVFSIILPKKAFISKFVMLIDGKNYEAYVKEKHEAKQIYEQAVASGLGAAHVETSARNSNRFTVSVNVQPNSKAVFLLTYEELLERQNNQYELTINIHPRQPVEYLQVNVWINESLPIKFVRVPPLRSGNDINSRTDLDPRADIRTLSSTSATVAFLPTSSRQMELAKALGTKQEEGLSGQFIVQYDVERNQDGGEILLEDGYFVHFFAPVNIPSLPKHVLFVLDTSASMYGTKIEQLKTAMTSIIAELKNEDFFHIIEFNTLAQVLEIHNINMSVLYPSTEPDYYFVNNFVEEDITAKYFPDARNADEENKHMATQIINALRANGGTNIHDALKVALHLIDEDRRRYRKENALQPLIIFLTDGDATVGITHTNKILTRISDLNVHAVPIFCLSFGQGANRELLQKLSLRNRGFSRHIYEAADAFLQLEDFYKQISSPLLSNVKFKYTESASRVTKTDFPLHFAGSELVVSGQIGAEFASLPKISGWGVEGPYDLVPVIRRPVAPLERLWAYLTIQQLLDDRQISENQYDYDEKILDLALNYSFVTPVSSLVVVKPDATASPVEPEAADKGSDAGNTYASAPSLSAMGSPSAESPEYEDEYSPLITDKVESFPETGESSTSTPQKTNSMNLPETDTTLSTTSEAETTRLTTMTPEITSRLETPSESEPEMFRLPPSKDKTASREPQRTSSTTRKPQTIDSTMSRGPQTTRKPQANNLTTPKFQTKKPIHQPVHLATSRPQIAAWRPSKPRVPIPNDIDALKRNLPWLENVLTEDGNLRTSHGELKLDLNKRSADNIICPSTMMGGEGVCKYIHECPEVHYLITNVHILQQYHCALNGFAAICCPPK